MTKKRKVKKKKAHKSKAKKHSKKEKKISNKPHKSYKPKITQTTSEVKVERLLIENFVSLQKVLTNLSVKMDNLTNQISKLLSLFELSAKALAQKDTKLEKAQESKEFKDRESKKIIEKIDKLLDQNKVIAQGLTLMHDKIPEQQFTPPPQDIEEVSPIPITTPKPLLSPTPAKPASHTLSQITPRPSPTPPEIPPEIPPGYERSISPDEFKPSEFKPDNIDYEKIEKKEPEEPEQE